MKLYRWNSLRPLCLLCLMYLLCALPAVSARAAAVTFDRESVILVKGKTTTLGVTVPEGSASGCRFASSNTKVASVGKKTGIVKARRVGSCTITCTLPSGRSGQIKVRVYASDAQYAKSIRMILIGHRGDMSKYLENTLAGISSTMSLGWDGAECDVHYTNNGDLFIFHDENLSRMCGVNMSIYDVTKETRFSYPLRRSGSKSADVIPTLEEVLEVMKYHGGMLVLHSRGLNNEGVDRMAAMIRKYGMTKKVIIYGDDIAQMQCFAQMGFVTGYLYYGASLSEAKAAVNACTAAGITWLFPHINVNVNRSVVSYAHSMGMKVGQVKVTTRSQLTWLQKIGADMAMMNARLVKKKAASTKTFTEENVKSTDGQ